MLNSSQHMPLNVPTLTSDTHLLVAGHRFRGRMPMHGLGRDRLRSFTAVSLYRRQLEKKLVEWPHIRGLEFIDLRMPETPLTSSWFPIVRQLGGLHQHVLG